MASNADPLAKILTAPVYTGPRLSRELISKTLEQGAEYAAPVQTAKSVVAEMLDAKKQAQPPLAAIVSSKGGIVDGNT